uniref:Uncharacterized protein n=1 Tax=Globisporangium ultimum (strain ATCC 200006 / CBS 805.95 / DAOM BR144) TaxID=431595 RepID=K3WWA4_GLOUD
MANGSFAQTEVLEQIASYLLGTELFALSHACSCTLKTLSQDHVWAARVHPETTARLPLTSSKERYIRHTHSFFFPGAANSSVDTKSAWVAVGPSMRDAFGSWGQPFSFATWFSLAPGDACLGGVLLGAQSCVLNERLPSEEPSSYLALAFVDSECNLICSVLDSSPDSTLAATKLEFNRWYHLALVYSDRKMTVHLNGSRVLERAGPLHRKWRSLYAAQVGTGYAAADIFGSSESLSPRWYSFNGVVDSFQLRIFSNLLVMMSLRLKNQCIASNGLGVITAIPRQSSECGALDRRSVVT